MNMFVCDDDDNDDNDDDDNRNEVVAVVVIAVTTVLVVGVVLLQMHNHCWMIRRLRVVVDGHVLCFNFVRTYVRT